MPFLDRSICVRMKVFACGLLGVCAVMGANSVAAQSVDKPSSPDDRGVRFEWRDHPSIRGGGLQIDLRARFQLDQAWSATSDLDSRDGGMDIARRRIGVDGRFKNLFDFQIEREIEATAPWRDVFVDVHPFKGFSVQAGQFKVPFSLDANTSATGLDFIYRSMAASQLAPGRDRGVMVHGRLRKTITYEVGVFAHSNALATATEALIPRATTKSGRLAIQPFGRSKWAAKDLQVGVAWTAGSVPSDVSGIDGDTAARVGHFFADDIWVQGRRDRRGLELRWRPGPFSLKGEWMRVVQERLRQSVEDGDLPALHADAWYVSGSWAITGEAKARGLEAPAHPLFHGGFGALEVAGRIESLTLGSGHAPGEGATSPRAEILLRNRDVAVTAGLNWYANRWLKAQWNAIHERIEDALRSPTPGRNRFLTHVFRLQVSI
jgi:phosphate-selective porin OprO and OprP